MQSLSISNSFMSRLILLFAKDREPVFSRMGSVQIFFLFFHIMKLHNTHNQHCCSLLWYFHCNTWDVHLVLCNMSACKYNVTEIYPEVLCDSFACSLQETLEVCTKKKLNLLVILSPVEQISMATNFFKIFQESVLYIRWNTRKYILLLIVICWK